MARTGEKKKHLTSYDIADELGLMALTPTQLVRHAIHCAKVGEPLGVLGRPGQGKTSLLVQISNQLHKQLIVERLNGRDPTDMGLPYLFEDDFGTRRHSWSSPDWFRSTHDPVSEQYPGGWVLFYDELAQALPAMQNRVGETLYERALNNKPMHDKVWVVWAANFAQDKAATYPIPRQILNRSSVVVLAPDQDDFFRFCSVNKIRAEIPAFVKLCPDTLDSYDADAMVNCTPRSLVALSALLDRKPSADEELALYSSIIGKGYGAQFVGFMRTWRDLPKLETIIANPKKAPLPDEDQTDVMCAVSAMLGRAMDKLNAAPVIEYLVRLPAEFCVFSLREAMRRDPDLKKVRAVTDWAIKHGDVVW